MVDAEQMLSTVDNDELAPTATEVRRRLAAVVERARRANDPRLDQTTGRKRDPGLYIPGDVLWVCPDGLVVSCTEHVYMGMTATARPIDGTLRHEVEVNGRHTIVTDEPARLGGTDAGPAPHELLPAMLAACVSTMIMTYANARGLDLGELQVDVDYDSEPTPRQVEVVVHVPAGLSHDQVERLRRIVNTCPVKRALEAGFTFDETIVLDGHSGAGAELATVGGARPPRARAS